MGFRVDPATPQEVANYIREANGEPPKDFRVKCLADPNVMQSFVNTLTEEIRDEGFRSRFMIRTTLALLIGDNKEWGMELARILLGFEPTPGFE